MMTYNGLRMPRFQKFDCTALKFYLSSSIDTNDRHNITAYFRPMLREVEKHMLLSRILINQSDRNRAG